MQLTNIEVAIISTVVTVVIIFAFKQIEKRISTNESLVFSSSVIDRRYMEGIVELLRKEHSIEIEKIKANAEAAKKECSAEIDALRQQNARVQGEMQKIIDVLLTQLATARSLVPLDSPAVQTDSVLSDMLVVIGEDNSALRSDLVAVRRSGMHPLSLFPATKSGLETILNRRRKNGQPIKYIHIASHAGPEGVTFQDGLAGPEWLADQMRDVEILLIAGCKGDNLGDWLTGIAKYVITMSEPVRNTDVPGLSDIGIFSESFWRGIRNGKTAPVAFNNALDLSPSWISEIAQLHFVAQ